MLAKLSAKNLLTLPRSVVAAVGPADYFDVQVHQGQIVLTPVRMQGGDSVRAKLADVRQLGDADIQRAVSWARRGAGTTRAQRRK